MPVVEISNKVFEFVVNGEGVTLRSPTLQEAKDYELRIASIDQSEHVFALRSYLAQLGLPPQVFDKMDAHAAQQLVEHLVGAKKK